MSTKTKTASSMSQSERKKPSKKLIAVISAGAAVLLAVIITLAVVLTGGIPPHFSAPESQLPIQEQYALTRYNYEDLDTVQATLRADVLDVTERGLSRTQPTVLSDDFSLVYNTDNNELRAEYGIISPSANLKTSSITFTKYPSPSSGIEAANFSEAAAAAGVTDAEYFAYYKYMLMTQGQHLAKEASRRSYASYRAEGDTTPRGGESLTGWLQKHPSADAQYGAVKGENNAVQKVITLDPLYRGQHTTGLYLPAGEVATVKIEGLKAGESISLLLGEQNTLAWRGQIPNNAETEIASVTGGFNGVTFPDSASDTFFKKADIITAAGSFYKYNNATSTPFLQSQWARQNARAPWLACSFTFDKNGEYEIGFAFGGLINLTPLNCYSNIDITITGAVETPHYILGVTTPEYFDEYLRDAPGVIGVLDTENGQLLGPTGEMGTTAYMRQIKKEEVDKLAMLWHTFFSVNESYTGGVYNRYNKVMFDWHVPAGAAVALGGYTFACPTGWFNNATNYRGLLATGQWGILHEIGHNHASAYGTVWGFGTGREGEVRNNALTLLAYITSCDVGTTVRNGGTAEHGAYANPYSTLAETLTFKGKEGDFDDGSYGYFQCLGMYSNIMHSFGADKYYELLYTYKSVLSYSSNKRADFAYRCSLNYGMNFVKYFNTFYCANITDDMFDEEQLAYMNTLPNYEPVANFYAGGIDGVKTAGDYIVAYGGDITFDLLSTTISSLDDSEKKGFEIIGFSQPEHGSLRDIGGGKYAYSFNKDYTGATDSFTFTIKLSDGIIHEFSIYLRIQYNGAGVSVYKGIENPGVNGTALMDALEEQTARDYDETLNSTIPGVPAFTSAEWEVHKADFLWKAPVSGEVSLAISGSGGLCLYFGESFDELQRTNLIYSAGAGFNHPFTVTVEQDKYYAIRIMNTNKGGSGGALVGILGENGRYAAIPTEQIFHPDYPLGMEFETYTFEPQFLVSKKDNINISNTGTDKSEWSVVTAPENVTEGRYLEETMTDPDTGEPIGTFTTDKWDWLIDGLTNTIFHTAWRGSDVRPPSEAAPDVFIIDTAREQTFNYFTITTRHTQNDDARITNYRLSVSSDNETYTEVSSGTELTYVVTNGTKVANLKFDQITGRYWKLEVFATTGKNFTIISELDAGIQSATQRVIPSTSSLLYTTAGWQNSKNLEDEPSGYIVAENSNEKAVIRFVGESIALYAATGEGYGTADIYVDGKKFMSVDLDSEITESRKLIAAAENLENKEHTVEIITTSADKVMLYVIGLPYTATLVNAPNIYAERALTISLIVFVLLFAAVLAFVLVLIFVPAFRKKVFGNRVIEKLDNRPKKEKKAKVKDEEPAEPAAKAKTAKKADEKPAASSDAAKKTSASKQTEKKTAAKKTDKK